MPFIPPGEYVLIPQHITEPLFGIKYTFARFGVAADGSCFFHSLCAAFNSANYLQRSERHQRKIASNLRCSLIAGTADHSRYNAIASNLWHDSEEHSLLDLKSRFCRTHIASTEAMIRFAMEKLKINIIFVDYSVGKLRCDVYGDPKHPTVFIAWIDRKHFEPLGLLSEGSQMRFVFDPSEPCVTHARRLLC